MKLPDWVRGMVYNLTDYFCWEKNLSAGDLSAFVTSWGTCVLELCPLVGVTALCLLRVYPNQPWGLRGYLLSLGCPEHPKRLQFCHWFLVLYVFFFSFHQGTHHMNQPLSISWHFNWIKRGFCRSVLQNNAVLLHLENICVLWNGAALHQATHVLSCHSARVGLGWFALERREQNRE